MSAELLSRLREKNEWTNQKPYFHAHDKCTEAADLIEAQAAEIERLRGVLAGIAEYGDDPEHPAVLNIADKALAALENKP